MGITKTFVTTTKCLVLSTKHLVAVAKFLVAATKILSVVPNFVPVTKPFFPCSKNEPLRYEGKTDERRNLSIFKDYSMNNHINGELSTRPFH